MKKNFKTAAIAVSMVFVTVACSAQAFGDSLTLSTDNAKVHETETMRRTVGKLEDEYGLSYDEAQEVFTLCTQTDMHVDNENDTVVYGYVWEIKDRY